LLRQLLDNLGDDPGTYSAGGLRRFVLERAGLLQHKNAKKVASATRMFLRYLAAEGRSDASLVQAIPRIAEWPLSSLPRYLPWEAVERLIASCDPTTSIGIRDQAILLLLARLGLRPADVACLRLRDLDWEGARLRVFGKGRRESWLPLPQDAGDALLRYLEEARPDVSDEHIFIAVQAPIRSFRTNTAVGDVVERAVKRTDVKTRSKGAYILRHSAATEMLRQGASMGQIGVVLRHRSINTTAIYAKVDVKLLRTIAQAWPGEEVSP
jgi:site-specific recombinase XerD